MNRKIAVLLKIYKGDLNPFDECALECALSLTNSEITVLAMAPLAFKEKLESLTRLGVKTVLISDPLFAGSDTIATSKVLAKAISILNPDLVFAGRQSVDGDTGQVPSMLSELLGFDLFREVMDINDNDFVLRDSKEIKLDRKQILTFEKFRLLRSPSIFSTKSEVEVWDNKVLGFDEKEVGLKGSPNQVIKSYENDSDRRFCEYINYSDLDKTIQNALKEEKSLKEAKVNKAPLIHYIGNIKNVAEKYANKVQKIEIEDLTISEICARIAEISPKIVLWEENDKYKPIAAKVAIRLNVGLCADCTSFDYSNGKFIITRPALGGDVFADIICSSSISMATTKNLDNKKQDVAITVGRGGIKYYEQIQKLAKKYNATVYCSRPIADEGLMDYSLQVGLTGIMINPKVCLTIGTSGAVQHIAGIKKSQTIIAINNDKKAKMFDYADYGILMDAKNI